MNGTFLALSLAVSVLAVLILCALVRAVRGPRFADRMVAVNCITTFTVCIMVILSLMLSAAYLLDVALIYALVGFLANVVLSRLLLQRRRTRKDAEAEALSSHGEREETEEVRL